MSNSVFLTQLDKIEDLITQGDSDQAIELCRSIKLNIESQITPILAPMLTIKDSKVINIPMDEILYIKSERALVIIATKNENIVVSGPFHNIVSKSDEIYAIKRGLATTKNMIRRLYCTSSGSWRVKIEGLSEDVNVGRGYIEEIKSLFESKKYQA